MGSGPVLDDGISRMAACGLALGEKHQWLARRPASAKPQAAKEISAMPHVDTPQCICKLGLARCDITPPAGIYHRMWGAATHDRATGVHRQLTATALVVQSADSAVSVDNEQVVVAVDHCLLWAKEMDALLETVSRMTGLQRSQIAVVFSHTHAAGLMGYERKDLPGGDLIAPYLQSLAQRIGDIVQQARHSIQLVHMTYGTGRCCLAAERDFWDEGSRQFVCGYHPDAPADDTVLIARVTAAAGKHITTIVNYACHPTTLAWQNTLISPDFPGAMREVIEKTTGVPCVFVQGASGDLGPREGFVGDTAVADRNGRHLGHAVLAALEALPPPATRFTYTGPVISGATLGAWAHQPLTEQDLRRLRRWQLRRWTLDLDYRTDVPNREQTEAERTDWQQRETAALAANDPLRARDCRAMIERLTRRLTRLENLPPGRAFPFPITLCRMGDAYWVFVESELYQDFQRGLRERSFGVPIMVATLTNGSRASYLPTADVYGKGIYQESIAVLAPGCLERLRDEIGAQIKAWAS
jgi:Neutral/alkaline non-lysosomal ceramidase, N-terminal